ncbi:hypothetical protein GH714_020114 [Hevea brasiliensis]|uniref:NB-ARC domain-containing protein n=1 Tax=Hevea brasiliensis TaxID=3981 RepID=A0A6A6MW49_HEVBR|nr:hypothetical protein GH714_020114 [Hevea brasiliensis]
MGSKMKGITTRLEEISSHKNDLDLRENLEGNSNKVRKRLPTTCLVNESQVLGRERDKEDVLELLMRDYVCDSKICVIAIVGMAGVGKTTLAQLIYNDNQVNDCFDLKGRLQGILTDKKFLLVLDDVWNENYHNWEVLCSPFRRGAPGSKIVVTTRNEGVASIMGSVAAYRLKELPYDSCLPLFTQLALGTNSFDAHPNLKAIGEGIVGKCKGLPLAAKTLGSLLQTKGSQDEWEDILHSKIWDLPEEQSIILPALRLSYHHLPSHLKQCFAYCSIFPKDYEFSKEELILLWMAEGFLQQPKGTKRMENLGAKYFDDLLSRSLFQQSSRNESLFVMHDLINYLAQYVAGEVCFRLEDRLESVQKARHVSYIRHRYEVFKKFEVLYKAQSLRTFLPLPVHMGLGIVNLINLRHLDITNTKQLLELPLRMGKLTNLRTLSKFVVGKGNGSKVTELRDLLRLRGQLAITGLHNVANIYEAGEANLQYKQDLQELVMEWSSNIELQNESDDRKEMDVLDMLQPHKNLKVLKIEFYAGKSFPSWIGHSSFSKLKSLTLKSCAKCSSLPSLGKLPFLADLCIEGMRSVKTVSLEFYGEDFTLTPFPSLKILTFCDMLEWEDWSTIAEEAFDSEFPCLCELRLRNCPKLIRRLPNNLPSLVKLDINKCPLLEVQLPTPFVSLELTTLRQIEDQLLPSRLEQLELCNCSNLKELPDRFFSFTSLADLKIKRCPKLVSFPKLGSPFMLRHLIIEECESLECLPDGMMTHTNTRSGSNNISHLESLEIIKCPSLKSFPRGQLPTSLKVLKIWDCMQLESLPGMILQNTESLECFSVRKYSNLKTLPECFDRLTHLIELHISYCASLELFPETGLPASNLIRFYVFNCPNLRSLPENMHSLTALQHLGISSCPGLVSFPEGGLPSNLKSIRINNCENLPHLSEWGLHRILTLKDLTISGGWPNLASLAQECWLPASLTYLRIGKLINLESLSLRLEHLSSLEVLEITECPKVHSLPKEGLPPTLSILEILDCPILKRKLLKKKGRYASIIANVPRVAIDDVLLQ